MTTQLRIGVTGHRPALLGETDPDLLQARVAAVFAAVDQAMAPFDGQVTLISCAAAGADRLAAAAGEQRGWGHEAILPFPSDDYARDFAEGPDVEAFRHSLATAQRVFALDGVRDDASGETDLRRGARAYERAGRVLLAQCDLLVGIWNGGPPGGPGGTGQVIAEAVIAGVPVIHLGLAADEAPTILWSGLNAHALGEDTVDTVARAGLDRLPEVLAALPGLRGADGPQVASAPPSRAWLEAPLAWPYRMLLWLTRARAGRGSAAATPAAHPAPPPLDADLAERFAAADRAASAAAAAYRGAYVANFVLAAAAVLVSLSGLVLPMAAKPLLLAGEIALIAAILTVTGLGTRRGWHQVWIEQRQLAERLRCLGLAARLGDLGLRGHGAGTRPGVQAEACVAARALGLPAQTVTPAWLAAMRDELLALTADQRGYFAREARTMHRLDHALHRAGVILFSATAAVCVAFLGYEAWLGLTGHPVDEEHLHHLALWVTLLTAAFPTLGAALHGIRMQGDFAGAAERSHAVDAQLAGLERAIRDELPSFDTLVVRMRRVMALLTEDLDSWTYTYQGRPLVLPG